LGAVLAKTVNHFFPEFRRWVGALADSRDRNRIVYGTGFLAWMGLMLFVLRLGARRQLRGELDSAEALENLNGLSGCLQEGIAHGDTVNHFVGHVPPKEWSGVIHQMIVRLLRMRVLDDGRLLSHHLVVIDGTGQLVFNHRHCEHCLEQVRDGKTLYYHQVLEAKLITPDGLALSIGSEFIENSDPRARKQDCELKAFERLAARLKKQYPQLPICLLLDALFANGSVFDRCREYRWKFIVTFKKGSLPALWREYLSLRRLSPSNRLHCHASAKRPAQSFAWVERLPHIDDQGRRHDLGAFQCLERDDARRFKRFAWLTNFQVSLAEVQALANRGGRCRWKIENEGFNIQKNGGFALEHAYSYGDWQIKGFYLLMQIAHMILQLIERGNLLGPDGAAMLGGLRTLSRRLAESLRNRLIPPEALDLAAAGRIQIRLDSS
jgi:hypothetical protein